MEFQAEINEAITKLRRIEPAITRQIKSDLREAAGPIVASIKGRAPISGRPHKNGSVTYQPGNLRKSIQVLPFRRTRNAVIVGPRARGGSPDGFYAKFLEFGTRKMAAKPFVDPAVQSSLPIAERFALELLKRRLDDYANKNSV